MEEIEKVRKDIDKKEEKWNGERANMNQKLQDLLMHNEKVKDECLKKVLVYKDKYQDYKQKVKRANQQITVLSQRVARYEIERGGRDAVNSKKYSPSKGQGQYQQRGANENESSGDQEYDYEENIDENEDD